GVRGTVQWPQIRLRDQSPGAGEPHMAERNMDGGEIFIEVLNSHGVEYIIQSAPYAERATRLHDNHRRLRDTAREEALTARDAGPIDPRWLSYAFNEAIPPDAVVVNELIVHSQVLNRYLERPRARSYMRSFGGLGQGLPNALGM